MLAYHVYQQLEGGRWQQLGQVRLQIHAEAILDTVKIGYIAHIGDIIKKKGF